MALKILIAPLRYVQGPDALASLGEQLRVIGVRHPLVLISPSARKAIGDTISSNFGQLGLPHAFMDFRGECTWDEIRRVKEACLAGDHDAIVNCGGGKTLDTGRAASADAAFSCEKSPPEYIEHFGAGVACINCPTVAATDASTSAVSLIYSDQGVVEGVLSFPTNPNMVLVDTTVIARSPVRLLVAGMGDALATYFEADMCRRTGSPSFQTGALSTRAAQALGHLCLDILLDFGVQAKREAEAQTPGPGIEAIAEANVLLSGIGFESGGLSASHAVGQAFHFILTRFETHPYHGELVAFGTLVQLVLEDKEPDYLQKILRFCKSVGLPTTFKEMGLRGLMDEDIMTVADHASRHIIIGSMPGGKREADGEGRFLDHRAIYHALKSADAYGRSIGE